MFSFEEMTATPEWEQASPELRQKATESYAADFWKEVISDDTLDSNDIAHIAAEFDGRFENGSTIRKQIESAPIISDNVANKSNFRRGAESATDSMQGSVYAASGLLGQAVGSDSLRDWGYEGYKKNKDEAALNPVDVPNFSDIKTDEGLGSTVGSGLSWAAGGLGQLVPSVVEAGATSLIGAGIGGAATGGLGAVPSAAAGFVGKSAVKEFIAKKVEEELGKTVFKALAKKEGLEVAEAAALKSVGRKYGAQIGIVEGVAPLEGGGMWGEDADKHGVENANWKSALALGQVSGLSEVISPGGKFISGLAGEGVQRFFTNAVKNADDALWKRLAIEVPKAMGGEFGQEAGQEFLGKVNERINDPSVSLFDKKALMQYGNAGAVGALGGVVFGGMGALRSGEQQAQDKINESKTIKIGEPTPNPEAQAILDQAGQDMFAAQTHDEIISSANNYVFAPSSFNVPSIESALRGILDSPGAAPVLDNYDTAGAGLMDQFADGFDSLQGQEDIRGNRST